MNVGLYKDKLDALAPVFAEESEIFVFESLPPTRSP
jgi:hypothetical protein